MKYLPEEVAMFILPKIHLKYDYNELNKVNINNTIIELTCNIVENI